MDSSIQQTTSDDWIRLRRDRETGIESVHAHFRGHAYDPHDHDEMLVGVTQQGVQQFRCHRSLHTSTPGRAILIEPGAVHDGHAPGADGFTYAMLYLPQAWVAGMLQRLGAWEISAIQPAFRSTLAEDAALSVAIQQAFVALHHGEGRLARDQSLDRLIGLLSRHLAKGLPRVQRDSAATVERARDFLHARMDRDIGLDELAGYSGIDRFRLARQFKQAFGLSPHPTSCDCGCARPAPCSPVARSPRKWRSRRASRTRATWDAGSGAPTGSRRPHTSGNAQTF